MDKSPATAAPLESRHPSAHPGQQLSTLLWPGKAVPVLLAHGFGQTQGAWQATASALSAHGHPCLSFDARGHGQSDRNPADIAYQPDQFVDDLIGLSGQFEQPPVLVAASMGGLFGLMAEARWPGLFAAMVLVDITPRWEAAGVERILRFMGAHPDGFDSLEHAADVIASYQPQRARKSEATLRNLLRQQEDGRLHWHWDRRLLSELGQDAEQHQSRLVQAARHVACPVLLLSGGRSDMVSEATITEFLHLVPHARHQVLPHATHMLAGDDNHAFTTTVLQYLDALPALATDGESATSHLTGAFQ